MKVGGPASASYKYEKGGQRAKWAALRSCSETGAWQRVSGRHGAVITAGRRGIKLMSLHVLLQRARGILVKSSGICAGN